MVWWINKKKDMIGILIKQFTIMNDIFMRNVLKEKACTEFILQTITENIGLRILEQVLQMDYANLHGRAARLDCVALDTANKGFTVHLFECGEGDHVYCFVSAPPKLSITAIIKYLKGITGRKLFERFPEIRNQLWKGELWNHSYYVETIGSVSEENIRRYIEHQRKSY